MAIEDPEPDDLRSRGELPPGQIHLLGRVTRLVDVPEMSFKGRTCIDLSRGDVEAGEEPLDDPCGRVALP